MELLPRSTVDFAQPEYWNKFFKQRGEKVFEWYGEYVELCTLLHKYMKAQDVILNVGCGNSKLSADLYDAGFKNLWNVDISAVVVEQMTKKFGKSRPGLIYEKMDVLNLSYPDNNFSVVLDKGTLDALMPDDSIEARSRISKFFSEVGRVLKVGGRYICISLLQEHILKFLAGHFSEEGWLIRVCHCQEAQQNSPNGAALPVFVIICTKFKKLPNMKPVFEFSVHESSVRRLASIGELYKSVKTTQEAGLICSKLSRVVLDPKDEICIDVTRPEDSSPRYTFTIIDKAGSRGPEKMSFAAFIVPQGRESEWLFSSTEGRQVLLDNCKVDRLAVITMHRGHEYPDLKGVQEELNDTVANVAPYGMLEKKMKLPFLSLGNNLGSRKTCYSAESEISGSLLVEEVEADGCTYRRLIFLKSPNVIQSEARLRKGSDQSDNSSIDKTYVSCEYHIYLGLGIVMGIMQSSNELKKIHTTSVKILVLGLGGGALCSYIQTLLPKAHITAVDIDPAVIEIATNYFGLAKNDNLRIEVQDGLVFLKDSVQNGEKYDFIIFDVDCKDSSLGLSCPPQSFLEPEVLESVISCLSEKGMFLLNLVCRASEIKKNVYNRLKSIFKQTASIKLEKDVNEVIYTRINDASFDCPLITQAAQNLNSLMDLSGIPDENFIDITDLSKWMKLRLE
ncbi:unnamed protein product [Bemisia tabaci]|uniref:Methyltransferase type 11 domain-containing protein n=1 Tax=Bemisia tabaci TaxID=7038 RepID=A0A9P0A3L9_BEMTA|nr:unnamed protein product [Bemisia tabaci]